MLVIPLKLLDITPCETSSQKESCASSFCETRTLPLVRPRQKESCASDSSETQSDITSAPSSDSNIRGNYKHFTLKQKLKVQEFAKLHGICTAVKHIKILRSTVNTMSKLDLTSEIRDKKGALQGLVDLLLICRNKT